MTLKSLNLLAMKIKSFLSIAMMGFFFLSSLQVIAQEYNIQYFRPWDKHGINIFENSKNDSVMFKGTKVRIGGSFTQQFQALSHENATGEGVDGGLYNLGSGFNLATANLNLDIQLGDGIRIALENYMSSRHHPEFWVKGGYIQIDKLPILGQPQWFTDNFRVKIGHFQVNYGDQHFRRTDNGNALYNPFVGNYILDAFATEIGAEVYYMNNEFTAMAGLTNGLISGNILDYSENDNINKNPAVLAKLAYDKQMEDLRFRISGSLYLQTNGVRSTLYTGDRTGSRYYLVMAPDGANATDNFTTGRYSPNMTNKVTAIQINPFIKWKGLEIFGALEFAQGSAANDLEDGRSVTHVGADVIYRIGANEEAYIAGRYNTLSGQLFTNSEDEASINRFAIAAGWFPTKNLLLKAEYVNQQYNDFTGLLEEGKFNGVVIEAVVGF